MNLSKRLLIVGLSLLMTTPCFAQTKLAANSSQFLKQNNTIVFATSRGNKSAYIQWLNSIDADLKNTVFNQDFTGDGRLEIKAASTAYERWDNALNEIYGVLKEKLPAKTMENLRQAQRQWIVYRDSEAEKATAGWNYDMGHLWARIEYTFTLVNLTQERCYYLVNNYM